MKCVTRTEEQVEKKVILAASLFTIARKLSSSSNWQFEAAPWWLQKLLKTNQMSTWFMLWNCRNKQNLACLIKPIFDTFIERWNFPKLIWIQHRTEKLCRDKNRCTALKNVQINPPRPFAACFVLVFVNELDNWIKLFATANKTFAQLKKRPQLHSDCHKNQFKSFYSKINFFRRK